MAIDFSDPEAMRLNFAQIEDRQAPLLLQIKDKDEQMKKKDEEMKEKDERERKRRRLHEEEVASLRQEIEGSPLLNAQIHKYFRKDDLHKIGCRRKP
ncbi:hypothetical protein E4U45_000212 [Claviceps purpurea]|nr:hypothetical protein E4U45_000212 [Claviceps purpurea]